MANKDEIQPSKSKGRVEFGNEFGDFNAAKFYEMEHMTKKKKKDSSEKNCGGL